MAIDTNKILDEADSLISVSLYDQAIEKYNYILKHEPNCADALLMRGALFGETGKIDKAIIDLEKSILYDNKNDSAFLTLAYLYQKNKNNLKSLEQCRNAIALNKSDKAVGLLIKLCNQLGNQMLAISKLDDAENYFKLALSYKQSGELFYRLALVSNCRGKIEDSIALAKQALTIEPNHIRAKTHIAASHELLGEFDKANLLIEGLIKQHPAHPMVNLAYAQYALRTKKQQEGISALLNMLKNANIQEPDLISANMFLGKLYDSIHQYDDAFKYFNHANQIQNNNYDPQGYKQYISTLIDYFTKEKYSSIPYSENTSDDFIFITGMPRSGTSLIEHIISSHSSVFGAGELPHVNDLAYKLQQKNNSLQPYPNCLDDIKANTMSNLADSLTSNIKSEANKDSIKITDKLPSNFHHIGLIHKLLPKAKIINCVRNAKDTCLSCYFQSFTGYHPYTNNLHALGVHYLEYEKLMNHWINELNIPVLNVSYENLVSDTQNEIKRILDYLDLPWEDACMEFYKQKRTVATASYNQVNKKIYNSSIERWKHYEKHLSDLIVSLNK